MRGTGRAGLPPTLIMTDALHQLRERARKRRARIVLPETRDPRTVEARAILERDRLCEVVWVEDPRAIRACPTSLRCSIAGANTRVSTKSKRSSWPWNP
jgi:phosphotransacetylase